MPNNLVFNNVANELKTQIYGNDGGVATAVSVDADGNLIIGTIETISYVASVDTVNEVANVSSVDTVDEVTNVSSVDTVDYVASVDTVNEVANVSSVDTVDEVANVSSVDTVDYVASVDTVNEVANVSSVDTVDEVANVSSVDTVDYLASVGTVAHITDTVDVKIVSNDFVEDVATVQPLSAGATATVLNVDTSEKNLYSFYVKNTSTLATIDAQVQIAPIDSDEYYMDDAASVNGLAVNDIVVLAPQKYLKYTRLILSNNSTDAGSVVAYFQGHN